MRRNTFEASGIGPKSFVRVLERFKISKKSTCKLKFSGLLTSTCHEINLYASRFARDGKFNAQMAPFLSYEALE